MRRARWLLLGLVTACGSSGGGGSSGPSAIDANGPPVTVAPPPPTRPELPPGTRSLRLTRTVAARLGPDEAAKRIGTVAGDTRVGWRDAATGPGCTKSWYAIEPQGWVCGDFLEASPKSPSGIELPRLDRGEVVPGTYGKVIDAGTYVYSKAKGAKPGAKPVPPPPPDEPPTDPDDERAEERASAAEAAAAAGLV